MEEYEDPEPKGKLILKVGRLVSKYIYVYIYPSMFNVILII